MKELAGYIAVGLVSLIVGLLLQRFREKPRLLCWVPGSFIFNIKTPELKLRTDFLTIQNVGRQPATNIEIIHKIRPDHFQFSIPIDFVELATPNGEHVIKIASLGPKEHINIQLLSHMNDPLLLNVRSSEGRAKLIKVRMSRAVAKPLQYFQGLVVVLGLGFLIYWVVNALVFLSRAIGVIN